MEPVDIVSWKIVQWVFWAGPFGVLAFLVLLVVASFCAGCGMMAKQANRSKIMQAQKLDKVKVDMDLNGNQLEPMLATEVQERKDSPVFIAIIVAAFVGYLVGGYVGYNAGQRSALVKAVEAKR